MAAVTQAPQPTRTRPPKRPPTQATANRRALWFLLLPALLPVVLFSVLPLAQGIFLGFTDARAGRNVTPTSRARQLRAAAGNGLFWSSFQIGIVWAVTVTFLQFVLGLGLALLLNVPLRFQLARAHPRRWCRGRCRRSSSRSCGS